MTNAAEAISGTDPVPTRPEPPKPAPAPPVSGTRPKRTVTPARIQQGGYQRNKWDVVVEAGTTLEDLLRTDFWVHVGGNMKPFDTLEVVTEDGTMFAELFVVAQDRTWVKTVVLIYKDLTEDGKHLPAPESDAYEIKYMGPMAKFAVIRKSDKSKLKDGIESHLAASMFLDAHLKSVAK